MFFVELNKIIIKILNVMLQPLSGQCAAALAAFQKIQSRKLFQPKAFQQKLKLEIKLKFVLNFYFMVKSFQLKIKAHTMLLKRTSKEQINEKRASSLKRSCSNHKLSKEHNNVKRA